MLPRALRTRRPSGEYRAMRLNGRAVTSAGGAPCCCGGGESGPCETCFFTRKWNISDRCFESCPPPERQGCCEFGSRYEWDWTWESRRTESGTGIPTITYINRKRLRLRVRYQVENAGCAEVYRCLAREIYRARIEQGQTFVDQNITTCPDAIERQVDRTTFPHGVDNCTGGQQSLVFGDAPIYRDGPDAERCSGTFTRVEGTASTRSVWAVNMTDCFSGTMTSERHYLNSQVGQVARSDELVTGSFVIVKINPCQRSCTDTTECQPCEQAARSGGRGVDAAGNPIDPGVAENLRRQQGCVGCGQ